MMPRGCDAIRDDLVAYADQVLDARRREQVACHLAGCHDCRAELSQLDMVRSLLTREARATRERCAVPGHLADQLVAIAGAEAGQRLWLAPERGSAALPSLRRRRRLRIAAGTSMATAGVLGALGGAWLVAPELPDVATNDVATTLAAETAGGVTSSTSTVSTSTVSSTTSGTSTSVRAGSSTSGQGNALAAARSSSAAAVQCPEELSCPDELLGLPLVRVVADSLVTPTSLRATYAGGGDELVLVVRRGHLVDDPGQAPLPVTRRVWQSGSQVYLVLADSAWDAQHAEAELPHAEPAGGDGVSRVRAGLVELTGTRGR